MVKEKAELGNGMWYWYHNISECYYHIQLTVKYRKSLMNEKVEKTILESWKGIKERYGIEISHVGFDQNHVHLCAQFLPKYSGGQVIKVLKSISGRAVFREVPEVKKELWGGEFWTDGYYIGTISARGNRQVIINYIKNQGRTKELEQLRLFDL